MPGLGHLHPLQNSPPKTADVTVWVGKNKTQVLLQVEVQSSPRRETVIKSVYGAADILHLLHNSDANFKQFMVFAFPKCVKKNVL